MAGVCLITGATSGVGRATALELAKYGSNLILVGRSEPRGIALASRIRGISSESRVAACSADLSEPAEVAHLAIKIRQSYPRIDVLINNAGARFNHYGANSNGTELTFATNHLGHYYLTSLLLDRLIATEGARIITVGSCVHHSVKSNGEWMCSQTNYQPKVAYAKSKLANIMFSYELARRYADTGLTSNAVDPGLVLTRFSRNNGLLSWLKHVIYHGLKGQLISAQKAAETIVFLATSAEVAGITGKYWHRNQQILSSPASYDQEEAQKLWDLSTTMVTQTGP
jgi:NAD(P)-dependent dehydrogenase (short-subunit alcohol dehydrogenase family)